MNHEIGIFTKALIIFNRRALMIRRSNNAAMGKGEWDIPGGGFLFGETPLDCVRREIIEEAGATPKIDRLLFATSFVRGHKHIFGLVYLCHADNDIVTLSDEHTEFMWATRQQLEENLYGPMLEDYKANSIFEILEID